MRIHRGDIPPIPGFDPAAEGLHDIRSPKPGTGTLLAGLTGFALLVFPFMCICLTLSYLAIPGPEGFSRQDVPVAWASVVLALVFFIPLHEALHLFFHPRFGASDRSVLVLWLSKFRFGVYYDGCMSRTSWLLMRIAPFLFLSLLPLVFLGIIQYVPFHNGIRTFMEVLAVVNGVGSGGDVLGIFLVLRQVPPSASLCFRGGKAYWRPSAVGDNQ